MANVTHYDVGDLWQPQFTFTVNNVNTDPTTLTITQQAADGTETVIANAVNPAGLTGSSTPVAKTATGVFLLNPGITLSVPGYWFVKAQGTGAAAAAETQQAIVDPDEFGTDVIVDARALVSLAEMKDWLNIGTQDTGEDLEISYLINAASNAIHQVAQREFMAVGTNPQTRDFDLEGWMWYADRLVPVGDMSAVTSASIISYDWNGAVADTTVLSNLILLPRNRQQWEPIQRIKFPLGVIPPLLQYRPVVRVVGSWGFPQIPQDLKRAVKVAVSAWRDRTVESYRQDFSVGQAESQGEVIVGRGQFPTQILPLPPDSLALAVQYRQFTLV